MKKTILLIYSSISTKITFSSLEFPLKPINTAVLLIVVFFVVRRWVQFSVYTRNHLKFSLIELLDRPIEEKKKLKNE